MITHRICPRCGKEFATGYDALLDRELPTYNITIRHFTKNGIDYKIDYVVCEKCCTKIYGEFKFKD